MVTFSVLLCLQQPLEFEISSLSVLSLSKKLIQFLIMVFIIFSVALAQGHAMYACTKLLKLLITQLMFDWFTGWCIVTRTVG